MFLVSSMVQVAIISRETCRSHFICRSGPRCTLKKDAICTAEWVSFSSDAICSQPWIQSEKTVTETTSSIFLTFREDLSLKLKNIRVLTWQRMMFHDVARLIVYPLGIIVCEAHHSEALPQSPFAAFGNGVVFPL